MTYVPIEGWNDIDGSGGNSASREAWGGLG